MTVTLDVVLDRGAEGLHRVTSILAHQRVDVRYFELTSHPQDPNLQRLTMDVEAAAAAADQLVKRLRRALPVRCATAASRETPCSDP